MKIGSAIAVVGVWGAVAAAIYAVGAIGILLGFFAMISTIAIAASGD